MNDNIQYKIKKYQSKLNFYQNKIQTGGSDKYKIVISPDYTAASNDDQDRLIDSFLAHENTVLYNTMKIVIHWYGAFANICFRSDDGNIYIINKGLDSTGKCLSSDRKRIKKLSEVYAHSEVVAHPEVVARVDQLYPNMQDMTGELPDSEVHLLQYKPLTKLQITIKGVTYTVLKKYATRGSLGLFCLVGDGSNKKLKMIFFHRVSFTGLGHRAGIKELNNFFLACLRKYDDREIKENLTESGLSKTDIEELIRNAFVEITSTLMV